MSRFTIGIVGNGTNLHSACFADFAKALADVLRQLGHEVTGFDNPGRLIMFGANNMTDPDGRLPDDAIVFNTEQVSAIKDPRRMMVNYEQYKKRVVWDYSQSNIDTLKKLGIEHAVLCPLGYTPSMTSIAPADEEDIDVLFYGSENAHRRLVLDQLASSGVKVVRLFGIYGKLRDELIARSKIVLNMHYFENGVFEIFRVSHVVANGKLVVSEAGGCDAGLEEIAKQITVHTEFSALVNTCRNLVTFEDARNKAAKTRFEAFSKISLIDNVRRALEQS